MIKWTVFQIHDFKQPSSSPLMKGGRLFSFPLNKTKTRGNSKKDTEERGSCAIDFQVERTHNDSKEHIDRCVTLLFLSLLQFFFFFFPFFFCREQCLSSGFIEWTSFPSVDSLLYLIRILDQDPKVRWLVVLHHESGQPPCLALSRYSTLLLKMDNKKWDERKGKITFGLFDPLSSTILPPDLVFNGWSNI